MDTCMQAAIEEARQDPTCVAMMQSFIANSPELWNEDIGAV